MKRMEKLLLGSKMEEIVFLSGKRTGNRISFKKMLHYPEYG